MWIKVLASGLSLVYGLVKQHKGFVEVHSTLGEGTRIKVYLPLLPTLTTSATNEIDTPGRGRDGDHSAG